MGPTGWGELYPVLLGILDLFNFPKPFFGSDDIWRSNYRGWRLQWKRRKHFGKKTANSLRLAACID